MRWLLLAPVLALVAGCASHTQPAYPVGVAVHSPLVFGSKRVPLPPGKWTVVAATVDRTTLGNPFQRLMLLNADRVADAAAVEISTNVVPAPPAGWVPLATCLRRDMLFAQPPPTYGNHDQDCWYVNHFVPGRTGQTGALGRQALDAMAAQGRPLPNALIYAGFRVADSSDVVTARYFFDPAMAGVASAQLASWQANEWHVDRVSQSPERRAYVEKVVAWGREWFPKMRAGFRGEVRE